MAWIKRALISVSDKSRILELARPLAEKGVELISTGGTARSLRQAGLNVIEVSDVTGFPEILDGRVKTLHPAIHAGILARRNKATDRDILAQQGIEPIDLVVVNLYPFRETLAKRQSGKDSAADCLEMIDIGGPALIRAAAKNHSDVIILVEPDDYRLILDHLEDQEGPSLQIRRRLAATAFAHVAAYDAAITHWLDEETDQDPPGQLNLAGKRVRNLRYGENPHQKAAVYVWDHIPARGGIATASCLQGKALSYNNINDADTALALGAEFSEPTCVIIKHANPCGVACRETLREAFLQARSCDPQSAFGGIIAFNRPLDEATATALMPMFAELIIAPHIEEGARHILAAKTDLRLLEVGDFAALPDKDWLLKTVSGGFLAQTADDAVLSPSELQVVTKRQPDSLETEDLMIAWKVCKHVASNAIIYVRDKATTGIGAGQMSRVDSARIALAKAAEAAQVAGETKSRIQGSVMASDAFFPFADGLAVAAEAGIKAVIQPGGSKRDEEVIALADQKGIAMVFTGIRHFRH